MPGKKLIVVVGPTAVGKTEVAIRLAELFGTEIISADSRQIYRELNIGTAKPTQAELNRIKHHFINSHSLEDPFDAGSYGRDALQVIHQLFQHHNVLILCGGSGLYVKALLEGFDEMPEIPVGTRESIMADYSEKGLVWLQQEVRRIDPTFFAQVDIQNPHRLIRALELHRASQKTIRELRKKNKRQNPFSIVKVGLELDREELYQRIDARMDAMIAAGLFEEATRYFHKRQLNALQTVGYREIFGFLEGAYDKEEAVRLLKRNTRHYAKRQLTWFKKDREIRWFNPTQWEEIVRFVKLDP